MKFIKRFLRDEKGQALPLFALMLIVLLGFTALAVDGGRIYYRKAELQKAADAAALAGVRELPNVEKAFEVALKFAEKNGVNEKVTPYTISGKPNQLGVEIEVDEEMTFAKVLQIDRTNVGVNAIAELDNKWTGEALPFINLGINYSTNDPLAWTKVGPGLKGTLLDFYTRNSGRNDAYFELEYSNGLIFTNGYDNGAKGLDDTTLKDGLAKVLTEKDMGVKKVYLFSIRSDLIVSGKITVNNGNSISINEIKNKDVIDPNQLVLLECIFLDCKWANQHDIELKFTGNVYDLGNNKEGADLPDFPTDYVNPKGGTSRLVE